ncbi:uncharacterized protein KY384_006962 [Bacidia gigantensis]|uniref:uncharacterized protein n=1 Tax=Bacidia gigantensis TaxID=2732470 RepID=UPI001D05891C|nr:uncharacterized protein KY384_006962 [Bacidia gigantensis]KAG8528046.1 hypothetical protein KY384_006962 [Bacidia gigantensis]
MSQSNNPTPPVPTNTQITQNLKRKLGQRSPKPLPLDQVKVRSATEIMSHVEIPDRQNFLRGHSCENDVAAQKSRIPMEGRNGYAMANDTSTPYKYSQGPSHPILQNLPNSSSKSQPNHTVFRPQQGPLPIMKSSHMREKIQEQFSLEIMIKHRELRLIEQEIAKCQVAMEQLRRCHTVPYRVFPSNAHDLIAARTTSGEAFRNTAPYAPPWGVIDGPYSHHYETWLLYDPAFHDSIGEESRTPAPASKRLPDRLTRGFHPEKGLSGGQSRTQRGSAGRLKALPQGYPEPREEKGPMIVKRKSDHHLVKLVCLDCRRFNFNSVQGFINHCRIAHARQFASHDVAIEASGEEINAEIEGGVVSESSTQLGAASAGLVHPMIRSARPPPSDPPRAVLSPSVERLDPLSASTPAPCSSNSSITPSALPSTALNPSPQTPHLSALFARNGRGGDLDEIVTDAKQRSEIDLILQMEEEESSDGEPDEPATQSRSTRGPAQCSVRPVTSTAAVLMGGSSCRQAEHVQSPSASSRVTPAVRSPVYSSSFSVASPGYDEQGGPIADMTPSSFSPNTTDPHPAPSLVSDDGDLDNTHSESEASSQPDIDEHHDHYLHPMFNHDDLELGESNGFDLAHESKDPSSTINRRSRPSTSIHRNGREERHVTFVSPVRSVRKDSRHLAE